MAGISDAVPPWERAATLGVYRFWRDSGAIAGALGAGVVTDLLNFRTAILIVALVTALSGAIAAAVPRGGDRQEKRHTLVTAID
jgi:MFS family permease